MPDDDDQSGRVIFLAHRNDSCVTSSQETLACGNCGNKAWTVLYEPKGARFPRLRCTCCGFDGGHIGWVHS